MSGLTVGLASIDRLALEIEAQSSEDAKRQASKIFPVIDQYHWMLVTLLLCNALAMEALQAGGAGGLRLPVQQDDRGAGQARAQVEADDDGQSRE